MLVSHCFCTLDYSRQSAQIPSMKNFMIALLLGAILGAGAVWYMNGKKEEKPAATPPPTKSSTEQTLDDIRKGVSNTAESVRTAIDGKLDAWHLRGDDIKEELTAKGKVVRRQTREAVEEVKDATKDAAITTKIKGKYALDKEVSALNVSVNTTEGVVTLSGTASSYDAISKAMLIAMDTEGVKQVVSTIQVK